MKKLLVLTLTGLSLFLVSGCGNSTDAVSVNPTDTAVIESQSDVEQASYIVSASDSGSSAFDSSEYIGEEQAKSIALTHAGIGEADVTFIKAKLDYDDGQQVYDVEFYQGNTEYDYEINALTGDIVSFDYGIESYTINSVSTDQSASAVSTASAAASELIGEEQAKSIALNHAGIVEADVTFIKAKLDYDDGQQVYDVEFYQGNTEYDYEINALTGDIVSFDYDIESYTINSVSTDQSASAVSTASAAASELIGEEQAKSIALNHAGIVEADVTFIKIKLDYDDGQQVYDVEFYQGNTEYDYEINALTGDIVSFDYDIESYTVNSTTTEDSYIGIDSAKAIALEKADLSESEVTIRKTKLDYDDGMAVYEIEFVFGENEYEIAVNAATGAITEYDVESIYD